MYALFCLWRRFWNQIDKQMKLNIQRCDEEVHAEVGRNHVRLPMYPPSSPYYNSNNNNNNLNQSDSHYDDNDSYRYHNENDSFDQSNINNNSNGPYNFNSNNYNNYASPYSGGRQNQSL
jgi:hypothetical protein